MITPKKIENIPFVVQNKWSPEVVDEGFIPFPKRLLRCLGQVFEDNDFKQLQVVLAIVDYRRPDLKHPPSMAYLAFTAGLEEEEFSKTLQKLAREGLVEIAIASPDAVGVSLQGLLKKVERLTESE